jgi:F-type H+-transporting ATPase subunit gamma
MHTLESMRRRIGSAEDLHAVVRVMKALAAVSIRQYEQAVESLAAYSRTIEMGLQVVLRNRPEEVGGPEASPGSRWGILVFGSDQGMCGSFNEQMASFALEQIGALPGKPEDRVLLVVGARVAGRLEDAGLPIARRFPVPSSVAGITPVVHDVLLQIEELRFQRGLDRFLLLHHRALAGAASRPQRVQLLPVDPAWLQGLAARPWPGRSLPTHTLDWRRLFSALIRQHLFVALYRAFAESLAGENASRLASMQAAEKNIEEHLAGLTARYQQQRQQSITEELLDIVAGFETLTQAERQGEGASTGGGQP